MLKIVNVQIQLIDLENTWSTIALLQMLGQEYPQSISLYNALYLYMLPGVFALIAVSDSFAQHLCIACTYKKKFWNFDSPGSTQFTSLLHRTEMNLC